MRKTHVDPLKTKTTTKTLQKEGASFENDDRHLKTINEEDTLIPEVTGDTK